MTEEPEEPKQEIETIFSIGLKGLFGILSVFFLVFGMFISSSKWWEWPLIISMVGFCIIMVLDKRVL